MAAGGFPYIIITQPGSYKLSRNLTMNTTASGRNMGLFDVAIGIRANRVTIDLNGFSITVTNTNSPISHPFYTIADIATQLGMIGMPHYRQRLRRRQFLIRELQDPNPNAGRSKRPGDRSR